MTKISEGATYEFLVHGLGLFIIGLFLLILHWSVGLFAIILAIGLMASKTQIEIDETNNRIRKSKSLLFIRFGNWYSLKNYISAQLKYNMNVTKKDGRGSLAFMIMPAGFLGARSKPTTVKTYDLVFIDDTEHEFIFNQFTRFGLALKVVKALEKGSNLTVHNQVDNLVTHQLKNRRR